LRAVGKGQIYGLSARGLAVDTALNSGEEFPKFVEFWVERPTANSKQLTIYALLDSRRVTGAYRFTFKPGEQTVTDVKSQLYLRENVSKLGIAPLTACISLVRTSARRRKITALKYMTRTACRYSQVPVSGSGVRW